MKLEGFLCPCFSDRNGREVRTSRLHSSVRPQAEDFLSFPDYRFLLCLPWPLFAFAFCQYSHLLTASDKVKSPSCLGCEPAVASRILCPHCGSEFKKHSPLQAGRAELINQGCEWDSQSKPGWRGGEQTGVRRNSFFHKYVCVLIDTSLFIVFWWEIALQFWSVLL